MQALRLHWKIAFVDYIPWTVNLGRCIFAPMKRRIDQVLKILASNVKTLRLAHGLTQEELAFQAGLDRTYISQIERGVGNPSVLVLVKLADILKTELPELFIKHQ